MKTVMRYRDIFSEEYLVVKTRVRTINNFSFFTIIFLLSRFLFIDISFQRFRIKFGSLETIDDGNAKFVDVILL